MTEAVAENRVTVTDNMPDLMVTHGDRMVEREGVVLPLNILVKLCPIKNRAPEQDQFWAANLLREGGIDYEADLADLGYDVSAFGRMITQAGEDIEAKKKAAEA